MAESSAEQPAPDREPERELKPWVKVTGLVLAAAAVVGLNYAMFRLGYDQGAGEQKEVHRAESVDVNALAVANLTHLLQSTTADDAALLDMARNHARYLSWIADDNVRLEAEWLLATELLARKLTDEDAARMMAAMFTRAPQDGAVWPRRAAIVAEAMADAGRRDLAMHYYRYAATRYAHLGKSAEGCAMLRELAMQLALCDAPAEQVIPRLESMLAETEALGDEGKNLACNIMAYLAKLHADSGRPEDAKRIYATLAGKVDEAFAREYAVAAVCCAQALVEMGDKDRAVSLIAAAEPALRQHAQFAELLASAECLVARIKADAGKYREAFVLLCRAECVAMGRVDAKSDFWPCLYDQRGWINLLLEFDEAALADFRQALQRELPETQAQSLEGAGRACKRLGRHDEGIQYLTRCEQLLSKSAPPQPAVPGRVIYLLAGLYDEKHDTATAAATYQRAVDLLLPVAGTDEQAASLCADALRSAAYSWAELGRREEALAAWSALNGLPGISEEMRREATDHLPAAAQPAQEAAAAGPARSSAPAKRRRKS
ncbi:MAG: hypothetical protein ACI4OZ_04540 [Akkermansia sp.]